MNTKSISGPMTEKYQKDQIVCLMNEFENDLFIIHSGELIICTEEGSKITPIAILKEGEYIGELSFFDRNPRSAHVIALTDSTLVRIPVESINTQMPTWLFTIANSITEKIRKADNLIQKNGIKQKAGSTLKPLSIEQQRLYMNKINERRQAIV